MKKAIVFAVLVGLLLAPSIFINESFAQIPASKFASGDRVQVTGMNVGASLKVKQFPTTTSGDLGGQPNNSIGTVVAGPSAAGGVTYWNVNFDQNPDGWVSEGNLTKVAPKFSKDDEVEVLANSLRVRTAPSIYNGSIIETIYKGERGKVLGAPVTAGVSVPYGELVRTIEKVPFYQDGYIWWKINWGRYCPNGILSCTDLVGWSAESATDGTLWLAKVTTPSNTNVPPPNPGGAFNLSQPVSGATYQRGANLPVNWGVLPLDGYYSPVGMTVKLMGPYSDPNNAPTEQIIITKGNEVNPNVGNPVVGASWLIASNVKNGTYVVKAIADYSGNASDKVSISRTFNILGDYIPGQNQTSTPPGGGEPGQTGTAGFVIPAGGETWQQGQVRVLSWTTPMAWTVNEVSLTLVNANGSHVAPIAIVKNNLPESIQGGGDFIWTIPASVANGNYKIKAAVNLSNTIAPNDIFSNQFTIGTAGGGGTNQPPVISGVSGPTSLLVNQPGSWTISASDPNGDVLAYEAEWGDGSAVPAGAAAVLSHSFAVAGSYSMVFRVKDSAGLSVQYPFTVVVTATQGGGGGPIAVNDRVEVTGNVNVRIVPNSTILGTQYKDILYSGFRQFGPAKGVVVDGPQTAGGYTWWKINYDYGPDGWSIENNLKSLGSLTGVWGFSGDNLLARQIGANGGVFFDPYYFYVENGQVSIPSDFANNSLDTAGKVVAVGGAWNCQAISDYPPFRWVGYRCSYGKGNQPPTISGFTGPSSTVAGANASWQFNAADPEGALASYEIDWGDGSSKTGNQLSGGSASRTEPHVYSQAGSYSISLRVTDAGGLSANATLPVSVVAPCSTKFGSGDRVKVINTGTEQDFRVRQTPNGTIIGYKSDGALGTIAGGPSSAGGYCWWDINYDGGPRGWSAESANGVVFLELVAGSGQNTGERIVLNSPQAGDVWHPGETLVIRWTAPSTVTAVHIYLDGVGRIAFSAPNIGSYSWTIPSNLNGVDLDADGRTFTITIYGANAEANGMNTRSGLFYVTSVGSSGGLSGGNNLGGSGNPVPSKGFVIGCTVRTTANLNVRVGAGTNYPLAGSGDGVVPLGTEGVITDGYTANLGYIWWKMNFPGDTDGWSVEDYLEKVSCPSSAQNLPPSIHAFDYVGQPGSNPDTSTWFKTNTSLPFEAMATDPEGGLISYSINWGDGQTDSLTGASGVRIPVSHVYTTTGDKYIITTASDDKGLSTSANTHLVVTAGSGPANRAPVLDPFTTPNQATVGVNTTWQAKAVDPDGTALIYTFNWGDGMPVSTFNNVPSGQAVPAPHTYTQSGSRTITVTASDGQLSDSESLVVNVSSTVVNLPPVLTIAGPSQVYVFDSNSWQLSVRDNPNSISIPTVTITYNIDFGDGTSTTRTGVIGSSGVTTEGPIHTYKAPGDYVMRVTVSDGQLSTTQTYNIKVLPLSVPVISNFNGPATLPANVPGTWTVMATASTTMTWSVDWGDGSPLLSGDVWLSGETKTFTHTYLTTGQKNILVTVRGQKVGQVATQSKAVTVGAANAAPTVTSLTGSTALGVGVQGSWTVTGVDPEGGMLNYQVEWGDGNFSAYTGSSGAPISITHTYTMDNPYTIKVTAVDPLALRGNKSLAVNVTFPAKTACAQRFTGNTVYPYGEDVVATDAITVRSTASPTGVALVGVGAGTVGKVLEGPVLGGGYCWYKVRYVLSNNTVPPVGYTADNWIEKASVYSPAPTLTISGSSLLAPGQQGSWKVKAVNTGYDPINYVINWGDGTSTNYAGSSGAFVTPDPKYTYGQAGIKTIQVTATNSRGNKRSVIFEVNVK